MLTLVSEQQIAENEARLKHGRENLPNDLLQAVYNSLKDDLNGIDILAQTALDNTVELDDEQLFEDGGG